MGDYSILLRSAWLFLGRDACEMSPHHPKGTAREQLSHQQQGVPVQQLQPAQQMIWEGEQKKCTRGHNASVREGTEGSFQLPWFAQSHPEMICAPQDKGVQCRALPTSRQPAARRRQEAAGAAGTGDVLVCTLTEPGGRSTHAGARTEIAI